jgi:hypothetical protein
LFLGRAAGGKRIAKNPRKREKKKKEIDTQSEKILSENFFGFKRRKTNEEMK